MNDPGSVIVYIIAGKAQIDPTFRSICMLVLSNIPFEGSRRQIGAIIDMLVRVGKILEVNVRHTALHTGGFFRGLTV